MLRTIRRPPREKHFIHHAERIDSVSVDYRIFLQRSPLLRKLVLTLENIGIPASIW
ncbi:MAG: hypothetical protein U1F34_04805 [Gammaproteobacteria bacterium]